LDLQVKVYTARNVKDELREAQRDFIRASVGLTNKGKLLVPKMLHSFARGLMNDSKLAIWIPRFLPQEQAAFVEQCISKRRQSFLGSRNCGVLPFDSRFRYLFLPETLPWRWCLLPISGFTVNTRWNSFSSDHLRITHKWSMVQPRWMIQMRELHFGVYHFLRGSYSICMGRWCVVLKH